MKLATVCIFSFVICSYYVACIPLVPKLPSVPKWSQDFVWKNIDTAIDLLNYVRPRNETADNSTDTTEEGGLGSRFKDRLSYDSATNMFGSMISMVLLFDFGVKLQAGNVWNKLEATEKYIQSLKYETPEDLKPEDMGYLWVYSAAKEYLRKRTIDPSMKLIGKKALEPAELLIRAIKARIPEIYRMDKEDKAEWNQFQEALSKDFRHYTAYRLLDDKENGQIKSKDINNKLKILYDEAIADTIKYGGKQPAVSIGTQTDDSNETMPN